MHNRGEVLQISNQFWSEQSACATLGRCRQKIVAFFLFFFLFLFFLSFFLLFLSGTHAFLPEDVVLGLWNLHGLLSQKNIRIPTMLYLGGHNLKIVLGLRNLVWAPKSPKILGFHQEHLFRKKCNLKVCREGGSLHTFKLHFYHMYCDVNETKPNQNNIGNDF